MPSPSDKAAAAPKAKKEVKLNLSYGIPNFRWQMLFNAFEIEKMAHGVMLRVAYVYSRPGSDRTAAEVVPFMISNEGLLQLRDSSKQYIAQFTNIDPFEQSPLPASRQFSPLFANHVRLSRGGGCAEISLYTVPLMAVASASQGLQAANDVVECVQVGLLHSDLQTHERLVLSLLS